MMIEDLMSNAAKTFPSVQYVTGDATRPEGDGLKVIAHIVNNCGAWGAGFVMSLSQRWARPEHEYRAWFNRQGDIKFRKLLGAMQLVPVESDIYVANIVGQHGIRFSKGTPPVRYEAIDKGLGYLAQFGIDHPESNLSVHMPRIGCSLGGGRWSQVEPLLDKHFVAQGIPVTVYDWPGAKFNP